MSERAYQQDRLAQGLEPDPSLTKPGNDRPFQTLCPYCGLMMSVEESKRYICADCESDSTWIGRLDRSEP